MAPPRSCPWTCSFCAAMREVPSPAAVVAAQEPPILPGRCPEPRRSRTGVWRRRRRHPCRPCPAQTTRWPGGAAAPVRPARGRCSRSAAAAPAAAARRKVDCGAAAAARTRCARPASRSATRAGRCRAREWPSKTTAPRRSSPRRSTARRPLPSRRAAGRAPPRSEGHRRASSARPARSTPARRQRRRLRSGGGPGSPRPPPHDRRSRPGSACSPRRTGDRVP